MRESEGDVDGDKGHLHSVFALGGMYWMDAWNAMWL